MAARSYLGFVSKTRFRVLVTAIACLLLVAAALLILPPGRAIADDGYWNLVSKDVFPYDSNDTVTCQVTQSGASLTVRGNYGKDIFRTTSTWTGIKDSYAGGETVELRFQQLVTEYTYDTTGEDPGYLHQGLNSVNDRIGAAIDDAGQTGAAHVNSRVLLTDAAGEYMWGVSGADGRIVVQTVDVTARGVFPTGYTYGDEKAIYVETASGVARYTYEWKEGEAPVETTGGQPAATTAGAPSSSTLIEAEQQRLRDKYKGLERGHVLYRQGNVSFYGGDDFGHVGLYIGDFEATREYTVRDIEKRKIKVFRNIDGVVRQIELGVGEKIQKGDVIVGAVVEMLESGAVLSTVECFQDMEIRNPEGSNKDMEWRTTSVPPTPKQLTTIIDTALKILDDSEGGKVQYDLGEKNSTDWESGQREFDCVGMVEYCYEEAGLNPTPDTLEGGKLSDWYLRPQEQHDALVDPTDKPKQVSIAVKSPVDLHVYDASGRHVGLNSLGEIENQIPFVYFQPEVEGYPQGIILGDVGEEYRLVLEAFDDGSFDLRILDYNVSSPGEETDVFFSEVPIKAATRVELLFGPDSTDFQMSIDEDGDGREDRVLGPTDVTVTPIEATGSGSWLARYWWVVVLIVVVVLALAGLSIGLLRRRDRQRAAGWPGGSPLSAPAWGSPVPAWGSSVPAWGSPVPPAQQSPAAQTGWYVARDQQVYGPYHWDDMPRMARDGQVLPHDLVWHDTMPDWVQAASVPGLFSTWPGSG